MECDNLSVFILSARIFILYIIIAVIVVVISYHIEAFMDYKILYEGERHNRLLLEETVLKLKNRIAELESGTGITPKSKVAKPSSGLFDESDDDTELFAKRVVVTGGTGGVQKSLSTPSLFDESDDDEDDIDVLMRAADKTKQKPHKQGSSIIKTISLYSSNKQQSASVSTIAAPTKPKYAPSLFDDAPEEEDTEDIFASTIVKPVGNVSGTEQIKKPSLFDASDNEDDDDALFCSCTNPSSTMKVNSLFDLEASASDSDDISNTHRSDSTRVSGGVETVLSAAEQAHLEEVRQAQLQRMRRMKLTKPSAPAARGSRRIQRGVQGHLGSAITPSPAISVTPGAATSTTSNGGEGEGLAPAVAEVVSIEVQERQRQELKQQMDSDRLRRQRNRMKLGQQQRTASKASPQPESEHAVMGKDVTAVSSDVPAVSSDVTAVSSDVTAATAGTETRPRRQSYAKFDDDEEEEEEEEEEEGHCPVLESRPVLSAEEREHRLDEGIQAWAQYCCGDIRLMACYITEVLDITTILSEFPGSVTSDEGVWVVPWDPAVLLQMLHNNVFVGTQDEYISPSAVRKIYL